MTEKIERHEYAPARSNPFHCEKCPFLRGNPIHLVSRRPDGLMIRGTAHPNKTG